MESINWHFLCPGKPGFSYDRIDCTASVTILPWNFAQQGDGTLIQQCATLSKQIAQMEKWLDAAKTILKDRAKKALTLKHGEAYDFAVQTSDEWKAKLACSERLTLNSEALKEEYGDAWYAKWCKSTDVYTLTFSKVT